MNGATALPWVRITSRPRRPSIRTMGPSHHFLRTRMKDHSSPMMPSFSRDSSNAISPSIERVLCPPVHVLAERRLFFLVKEERTHHERVHVRAHEAEVGVVGRA